HDLGLAAAVRIARAVRADVSRLRQDFPSRVHARGAQPDRGGDRGGGNNMTAVLLAEFRHAQQLKRAASIARRRDVRLLDAFSPHHVAGLTELLDVRRSNIRVAMFIGGIGVAALAYGAGEFYTAVVNYPYNAGGRPLHAWPAFMLVPFATGILAASITGLIVFLYETGLPRLHHPLFAVEGFEQ